MLYPFPQHHTTNILCYLLTHFHVRYNSSLVALVSKRCLNHCRGCVRRMNAIDSKHPGPEVFEKGITPVPCAEPPIKVSGAGGLAVLGAGNSGRGVEPSAGSAVTPTKASSPSPPPIEANAGDERVLTTYITVMPSLTPSKEVHIQSSIPSAPITLFTSTIRYNPPKKTSPKTADGCTTEGITCSENRTWYMGGSGRNQFIGSLAAETTCTAGKFAKRDIQGCYF